MKITFKEAFDFLRYADCYSVSGQPALLKLWVDGDEAIIHCDHEEHVKDFHITAKNVVSVEVDRGGLVEFTLDNGDVIMIEALQIKEYR